MAEFEINGVKYKSQKIPAEPAQDILHDIMPVVPEVIEIFLSKPPPRLDADSPTVDELALEERHRILVVVKAFAAVCKLPKDTFRSVVARCLSLCERERSDGNGWAKIWNESAGRAMFDDIGLKQRGEIVMHVLQDNFRDFLPGAG